MVELLRPDVGVRPDARRPVGAPFGPARYQAVGELREIALDLLGRPECDELSGDERIRLSFEIDEAIAAVYREAGSSMRGYLPHAGQRLADLLAPRLEALPAHLRAALANARRRQLLGID